jgi:hypothetical protein
MSQQLTRRQALELLGLGAAVAAFPMRVSAQQPAFPRGAIIRTLLKDYAPEELAGGATLFHEHMQLATDFNARFSAASAAVRAANGGTCAGSRAVAALLVAEIPAEEVAVVPLADEAHPRQTSCTTWT